MSNTSGGYSFYKDARMLRLTRYRYNNVPTDAGGKYYYINEGGDLWTPGWMPVKADLEKYECRHGLGYTVITGKRNGLLCEQTAVVPLATPPRSRASSSATRRTRKRSSPSSPLWSSASGTPTTT